MIPEKIYSEDEEVDERLLAFGFTRSELVDVGKKTLAERANTIEIDVASMAGQLSYLYGSRYVHQLAISKGYKVRSEKNIQMSVHPESGIMISYQNVDIACSKNRSPQAISGKRSGSADLIDKSQGSLFLPGELPEFVEAQAVEGLDSPLWYLCVAFEEDSFSVELSLPAPFSGNNFRGFYQRIFITKGEEWIGEPVKTSEADYAEVELKISPKA
ncbi:MAG: hypothetical protein EP347_03975 [Alphaproteobacteria bacterium]|nr:MAG: hypothetical protein EP347_03975 [Alphaproteobacteria bacterium]